MASGRSIRWCPGSARRPSACSSGAGWPRTAQPRDGSWIEFLNLIKYPPSLVFTLVMVGGNLLLLDVIDRTRLSATALGRWLNVFGQAPLAFARAPLWLVAAVGAFWFRAGTGYGTVYIVWLAGLVPLSGVARSFGAFKATRPLDSLWRLL